MWTCVSTEAMAAWLLAKGADSMTSQEHAVAMRCAQEELSQEVGRLLSPFCDEPLVVGQGVARRWSAAFPGSTLEGWSRQEEDAISLQPFGLAIAGDFVRRRGCNMEAAALSGLEAGERVAQWLKL